MAEYSATNFYLELNNFHYYVISPNSENSIKAAIRHLPQDTTAEDISSSHENLRLQRHQREENGVHSNITQRKNRSGTPP
jgi:hypothetical protein